MIFLDDFVFNDSIVLMDFFGHFYIEIILQAKDVDSLVKYEGENPFNIFMKK